MGAVILNKSNFFDILPEILQKIKEGYEFRLVLKTKKEKSVIKPEVEKSWYRDPNNPKRFDYDIVEKEFTAEEAISFLDGLYKDGDV